MTDAEALVAFVSARLDEDEAWARAANRPYRHADEGSKAPETDIHWEWVAGDNWDPVRPDPATMEVLEGPGETWEVNLATVEKWPVTRDVGDGKAHVWMARNTYADSIGEMDPAAAGHIIRHDPARVLREVEYGRWLLVDHAERASVQSLHGLQRYAARFDDHRDYRAEWRPA